MSFDLENLREMEKKAEELKAEVKALEKQKSELSNSEQRALEKEKYELLLEEKRQLKIRKKEERKALKERRKGHLRNEDPEPSFFAKDSTGRNGIHKLGSFTWKAVFAAMIATVISLPIMTALWHEHPNKEQIQYARRALVLLVSFYFGTRAWKSDNKASLETQLMLGIGAIVTLTLLLLSEIKYMKAGEPSPLFSTSEELKKNRQDKPSQD